MNSSNSPAKNFLFIAFAAFLGIAGAAFFWKGGTEYLKTAAGILEKSSQLAAVLGEGTAELPPPGISVPPPPPEITLAFVGDIMMDRGVKSSVEKNFGGDYSALFENLSFKDAILFGNLEGPVSTGGKKTGSVYSFRMAPESLEALEKAGFNVLSMANNHIGDWGEAAFYDTLDNIALNGMKYTGAGWNKKEAEEPAIIEKDGIKVGFLGFTDVGPDWMEAGPAKAGILLASDPDMSRIVRSASKKADILVVSFHWGDEYKAHNERQEKLARLAIDSGAKIVAGHHPHVIQDTEEYGGGIIAYSLGNFIFDQKFSAETMEGLLFEVTAGKDGIKSYKKKIIKLNDSFQPVLSRE